MTTGTESIGVYVFEVFRYVSVYVWYQTHPHTPTYPNTSNTYIRFYSLTGNRRSCCSKSMMAPCSSRLSGETGR